MARDKNESGTWPLTLGMAMDGKCSHPDWGMRALRVTSSRCSDDATTVVLERMADVDPVGDGAVLVLAMLHDALVEMGVIDYPIHPITE